MPYFCILDDLHLKFDIWRFRLDIRLKYQWSQMIFSGVLFSQKFIMKKSIFHSQVHDKVNPFEIDRGIISELKKVRSLFQGNSVRCVTRDKNVH